MRGDGLLVDMVSAAIAGYVGVKSTNYSAVELNRLMPAGVKAKEAAVREGPTAQVAARKMAALASVHIEGKRLQLAGNVLHYGLGMAWGGVYMAYRRLSGMSPLGAGIACGASLSLIMDEGVSPAFGFSAPDRSFPLTTHLRGLLTHLVFGLTVAATVEGLRRLWRVRQ